ARTPSRASPTATLAGAPPRWRTKRSASRRRIPFSSGKKSTITSPKQRTSGTGQLPQELERAQGRAEVRGGQRVHRVARGGLGRGRGRARGGVGQAAGADEEQAGAGLGGERAQRRRRGAGSGVGAGRAQEAAARRVEDGAVETLGAVAADAAV